MAKIYKDEISAALSSDIFDRLDADKQESTNLKGIVNGFISSSKANLTGDQYDTYRAQYELFNQALEQRIALADNLSSSIRQALQLLLDYLGEDLFLDTSKLDEYIFNRNKCQKSLDRLKVMLNETIETTYTGSDGRTYTRSEKKYNSAEIQAQITLAEATLAELERIIKKVQGLDAVYAQAEGILNSAFSGISPFGSSVSAIKPDGIFSYQII